MEEFDEAATDDSGEEEDWQALVNLVVYQQPKQYFLQQNYFTEYNDIYFPISLL